MKKLLKIVFLFLILSFFLVPQAKAADLNIDCLTSPTACSKSGLDPLFSNSLDGFWYPGKTITKTLNLKNSGPETREMAIKGTRTSTVTILENVMHTSIIGGTTVIWSGSVADFYDGQDKIGMGIFAPGADLDYDFTVFMSSGAGNEYQNRETVFDLSLGFWGEPVPTVTPVPTGVSTPVPTSVPGGGGGGGGTVLGTGVSAPVCTDAKPGTPTGFTTVVGPGTGQVTLSWTPPSPPFTYFLVAYSDSPSWPPKWGNPNIGNSNNYTVSGLGTGTYWFWLRAGNGCATGDFVGPISPGAIAGISTAGVATGFQEGVLGVEEELGGEINGGTSSGEAEMVEGAKTASVCPFWWIVLIGQTIILGGFYFLNLRRKEWLKRWWLMTIGTVLIAYFIDHYAHTHWYVPSRFCPWEIWMGIGLATIETIIFKKFTFANRSSTNI